MVERQGLLSGGWSRFANNKRYLIWFYLLNLVLAALGAAAFGNQAHAFLDHSLNSQGILQGFDVGKVIEMFAQPEFGTVDAARTSGLHFALIFFFFTALFVPGVVQGYAATYRLPREDFFRACGRNLWRFIRLLLIAGIVMGIAAAALFSLQGFLQKQAAESTNELLVPEVQFVGLAVIFLIMSALRIAFDLAQTDVVLADQKAVRRSIGVGFRHMGRNLGRLLGSYIITTIVALSIMFLGLLIWIKLVPPPSVLGAFLVSQLTLLLLLIPRFWQRGIAVTYYLQNLVEPIVIVEPIAPATGVVAVIEPVVPLPPPEPQAI